jgi:hypothetical protein
MFLSHSFPNIKQGRPCIKPSPNIKQGRPCIKPSPNIKQGRPCIKPSPNIKQGRPCIKPSIQQQQKQLKSNSTKLIVLFLKHSDFFSWTVKWFQLNIYRQGWLFILSSGCQQISCSYTCWHLLNYLNQELSTIFHVKYLSIDPRD